MKHFFAVLILSVCITYIYFFIFEHPVTKYEVTVAVFYPTKTDTVKIVDNFYYTPKVSSDEGTNYIYCSTGFPGRRVIETSAPIKIISSIAIK